MASSPPVHPSPLSRARRSPVYMDIPGLKGEDLDIELENDTR
jgi:hypothetical protein